MNLLLLEPDEIDERGRAVLRDRRASHAHEVLQVTEGDQLRVGVIRGPRGTGEVIDRSREHLELQVDLRAPASPAPAIDLIVAMPRPKAIRRILRAAACMGVRRIDLVNAWRVDRSYLSSHWLAPGPLRDNLLLGCEQGMTTWLPDVQVHRVLMGFVRDHLEPRLDSGGARFLIADPDARVTVEDALLDRRPEPAAPAAPALIAAIGPERGWIPRELETFTERGGTSVTLCSATLTVEIAVTALLSQLVLLERLRRREP